ncbi:MAG: hypothetical protein KBG28_11535 [Kofleriaceae bacterium]|jgi:hypothetical protein|nr:hypothetical protein [Kofleriaceae bacterium]MBP6836945.1 hypothetical protein [Kofleriaceae bacterium]MBP9204589.1 hypothetical protein [Kofleriaceae bacterium]
MQHKQLLQLLTQLGWVKETASAYLAPDGAQATLYLEPGDEALIIDRVSRIDVGDDTAVVTTHRRERYGVGLDAIAAVRVVSDK